MMKFAALFVLLAVLSGCSTNPWNPDGPSLLPSQESARSIFADGNIRGLVRPVDEQQLVISGIDTKLTEVIHSGAFPATSAMSKILSSDELMEDAKVYPVLSQIEIGVSSKIKLSANNPGYGRRGFVMQVELRSEDDTGKKTVYFVAFETDNLFDDGEASFRRRGSAERPPDDK